MKSNQVVKLLFLSIATAFVISACDPKDAAVYPPEAQFFVNPSQGNTTTVFRFNTEGTAIKGTVDTMLFFRWDWDNDGTWDTNFSRSRIFEHRFYSKGRYSVRMEASSDGGLRDTVTTEIEVIQGYSAPHPQLVISPDGGHILTEFTLDASGTTDDEDSTSQLLFRWDFDGDGFFDTPWGSESIVKHTFSFANYYKPRVSVKDPSDLISSETAEIMVSMNNPKLVVDFTWTPEGGSTADVFTFDASASHDPDNPDNSFTYSWDFNADGNYELENMESPLAEYEFEEEGDQAVRLRIADKDGLINTTKKELFVEHANRPPRANFTVGADYGNTTTNFFFDANGVRDDEDWEYLLQVRWDFNSDGQWDTDYSNEKTMYHAYGVAGEFTITMEVIDLGGLTDQTSLTVSATEGTNETGLAIDEDTGDTYGTVKIGNQWWFAENLKNNTNKSCYQNNPLYCDVYGGWYSWNHAMNGSESPKARGLCPKGWHIPTAEEFQELFTYLGEETARVQLEEGGPTDFNLKYAGQVSTSGSQYAGQIVNYWTSSIGAGDNAWTYSLQKDKEQIWKLSLGKSYRNSVRCIKN